jgi:PKD repeat protein
MKKIHIISLILFTLLLVFCKKQKYPESVVENEVVYYARMNADGQAVDIKAGVDNYYLYSSHSQDSNGVYTFASRFATTDCESCAGTLQIQLTDFKNSAKGASVLIDSSLQIGTRGYLREGRGPFYTVEFRSSYNRSAVSNNYQWDFGKGVEASGFLVTKTFQDPGPYQICLTVKGNNGCSSSNCNTQLLGANQMRAFVTSVAAVSDSIQYTAHANGGKSPYTYQWDFGDGSIGTGANILHAYNVSGAYGVILTVKDADGKVVRTDYNAVTKTDLSSCAANYSIATISASTNGIQTWSKACIRYTTADGTTYSSLPIDQSSDAVFEIMSVEPAGTNEKGETIKKVKLKFSATLFSGTKNLKLENGEAVIAVAYH